MRLEVIREIQRQRAGASQPLYPTPESLPTVKPEDGNPVSLKRRLMQSLAPVAFPLKSMRCRMSHQALFSDWQHRLSLGYRFSEEWLTRRFHQEIGSMEGRRVLIPGTHFNTREARRWFGRPVSELHLLDIVDWSPAFAAGAAELERLCRPKLSFHHGTLDKLPLADGAVDVMESCAVLEHVGNMKDSAKEMARILSPDGLALHRFGPLYFTHGGDHCSAALGLDHGYDHLLLDDAAYMQQLQDSERYDRLGKEASDSRYWALQGIFSFLKPQEYLDAFTPWFDLVEVLTIVSEEALAFRSARPDLWKILLNAGLEEKDLLIGSMSVILRKRRDNAAH
jgi:SAM-dependent methyltransferase